MTSEGTALATLGDYEGKAFNVLHPIMLHREGRFVSPVLVESVSVVQINPSERSGETFHDFRFANEKRGEHALSALGLAKIANAAGIKWIPDLCRVLERERRPDGHVYMRYQAAGAVLEQNGDWHVEVAEKDIDTADEAEQIEDAYRRKLKAGRAKFKAEDIPEMVRREVMQLRQFLLGHAETKAKNRVIRRMLSLKQVYSKDELARPFAVPRLVYRPDLTDPRELSQVQLAGRRAAAELFGELPDSSTSEAETVEPASDNGSPPPDVRPGPGTPPSTGGREEAEAGRPGPDRSGEPSAEEVPQAPTAGGPERPKQDPLEESGPFTGKRWSEIAEINLAYLEGIIASLRVNSPKRALAQKWVDWARPRLEGSG